MDKKRISTVLITLGLIVAGAGVVLAKNPQILAKPMAIATIRDVNVESPVKSGRTSVVSFEVAGIREEKSWQIKVAGELEKTGTVTNEERISTKVQPPTTPGTYTVTIKVENVGSREAQVEVLETEGYLLGIADPEPSEAAGETDPTAPEVGYYQYGEEVQLEAYPASGWDFEKWTGTTNWAEGYSATSNPTWVVMKEDETLTPHFVEDTTTYTLSWEIAEGDGEIYVSKVAAAGRRIFAEGAEVEVQAAPAAAFDFDHWSGDVSGTSHEITVVMDSDKHVKAHFSYEHPKKYKENYTLTTMVEGEGTVSPSGKNTYLEGKKVEVEASPAKGWKFIGWKGAYSGSENPKVITMNSDYTLTAVFEEEQPEYATLTLKTSPTSAGSISIAQAKSIQVVKGEKVSIQAFPNDGWRFTKWTDAGGHLLGKSKAVEIPVVSDMTAVAHFKEKKNVAQTAKENSGILLLASGVTLSLIGGVMRFTPLL